MAWLINLFWPLETNSDPGFFGRLGRVAHWFSIVVGLGVGAAFLTGAHEDPTFLFVGPAIAAAIVIGGRAIRYIFSQE